MAASTTPTATINTFLMKFDGVTAKPTAQDISKAKKVVDIKSVPAFGGEPETLETTTLSDNMEKFILGVQKNEMKEFKSNYTLSDYKNLKELEGKEDIWWAVFLGADRYPRRPRRHLRVAGRNLHDARRRRCQRRS